jgi:UDP-glucuronate 4-epimerase
MKILITGTAGFIGFSLANELLENTKLKIYGIDNIDDYYSVKLKKKRIKILSRKKNFFFKKIDLNSKNLSKYLNKKNFDYIFHFAAQAGVRYSLVNPEKYIDSNILGYSNLLENLDTSRLKKVIYASSSSVYGDTKKLPTKENENLTPKNIYGYTKIINEQMASYYSKKFNIPFVGLRFFTVYGIWGRPDMFILKILEANHRKNIFYLNNNGNHLRDFTSIKDVIKICKKVMYKKSKNNKIYNVCSNRPILITKVLSLIENKVGKIRYKNIPKNAADVLNTHGNNNRIKKEFGYKNFENFKTELNKLIDWYILIKKKNLF